MSLNHFMAIRYTGFHIPSTQWTKHFHRVCDVIGVQGRNPTAKDFVTAVWKWQMNHPPLKADGVLGPLTWNSLRPLVEQKAGPLSAPGVLPEWLDDITLRSDTKPAKPDSSLVKIQAPPNSSDELMKEMVDIALKQRADPYPPYPVSARYLAHAASFAGPRCVAANKLAVGSVCVGQVWPGITGKRIVLHIQISGAGTAARNGAGYAKILFVTESGLIHEQDLVGWEADFLAMLYADLAQSLGPLETLLDVYAQFLLGAISGLHPGAAAFVFTMSTLQFISLNKGPISKINQAVEDMAAAMAELKVIAPTLHGKVVREFLKNVLADIPGNALKNPLIMARFAGQVLVKSGLLVLRRDPSVLVEAMKPILKLVLEAVAAAAKAATVPAGVALGKAVPSSLASGAKQLAIDLLKFDLSISSGDATKIALEIYAHPNEVKKIIEKLAAASLALSNAVSELK